jgi:hypothetical protein
MRLTFTLQSAYTGTTYVAGPFNISGTTSAGTTYWLATGVTKTQLTAGHAVDTIYETLTGGTIASTGTCTTTRSWQISEPEPVTVSLEVYGKDEYATPQNATITFTVNGSSPTTLNNLEPLPSNCGLLYTINNLELGDVVVIESVDTYPMSGVGSSTCPTQSGTATSYTHTIGISSGTAYVALSINSNNSV